MPETGTSGSMSGDGKLHDGQRPQATAPILDSTVATHAALPRMRRYRGTSGRRAGMQIRRS